MVWMKELHIFLQHQILTKQSMKSASQFIHSIRYGYTFAEE